MKQKIILSTLNARYLHTSLALRYIAANMMELSGNTEIVEFVIGENTFLLAEKLLLKSPDIIGFGVYIWNATETKKLIDAIKAISPDTIIIAGGPEVSYEPLRVDFSNADYIVRGEGERSFYELCAQIIAKVPPKERIINKKPLQPKEIALPYRLYTDEDIAHRYIYVEASRGCPFECEFCLSSIDERVSYFDVDAILREFETLWQRGARNFKFIDRSFNLNVSVATRIFDFFLSKEPPYLLHFEVIPDSFPQRLLSKIAQFPPASLQLEVGIQTLNDEVGARINRRLDKEKIKQNIAFLERDTSTHLHVDLIAGLPGESMESFGKNLNELYALTSSEIQLGILKKLSGTSIGRHDATYNAVYSDEPPYEILQNDLIPFLQMQQIKRFARFWDIGYNSGNFRESIRMLWMGTDDVFGSFFAFSEWVYSQTESTWQIAMNRYAELLFRYLTELMGVDKRIVADAILNDISAVGGRSVPHFLRDFAAKIPQKNSSEEPKIGKRQQIWAKKE